MKGAWRAVTLSTPGSRLIPLALANVFSFDLSTEQVKVNPVLE
jgi:hypothetical protein